MKESKHSEVESENIFIAHISLPTRRVLMPLEAWQMGTDLEELSSDKAFQSTTKSSRKSKSPHMVSFLLQPLVSTYSSTILFDWPH